MDSGDTVYHTDLNWEKYGKIPELNMLELRRRIEYCLHEGRGLKWTFDTWGKFPVRKNLYLCFHTSLETFQRDV